MKSKFEVTKTKESVIIHLYIFFYCHQYLFIKIEWFTLFPTQDSNTVVQIDIQLICNNIISSYFTIFYSLMQIDFCLFEYIVLKLNCKYKGMGDFFKIICFF